ncbi:hypothetical protein M413DRAFT_442649 [Hebeloma cylindrosporum]|uniref:CID domain-containing protein n=1 Tax=Hebeloma cylindrosporum TaxID=76867 RepID=A0A0C3CKR6_HEBCY|nr:hypothetical protein M413DRAFT_442649 [Hebeloma cylindrosporum h7]
MSLSEEFETLLKEVVLAKRLSASKMNNLTDIAVRNMEHDTQLVSILYRTHKTLPTPAAKVSSLYVFDALSRAAKHHSMKHGLSGDAFTYPGNSASFLFKVGGVVEGLFQDMVTSGSVESKEKTKKILDIWVKGNTFPSTILSLLSNILKGTEKVLEPKAPSTVDPRISRQTTHTPPIPPPVQSPPIATMDPQATLLALLTQAAATTANIPLPQTPTNIMKGIPPPQLDAAQLAVIQQLAHTAASVPSVSQTLTPPEPVNVQNFPSSFGVNGSSHSPPRNEPPVMVKSEQKINGYRSPEREIRPDPHFDERDNMRGRYRGGIRGRGDRFAGRNWDPRDRDRYRDTDRDQSLPRPGRGRGGRSRSRSPPSRYTERRATRFPSPPRKPRAVSPQPWQPLRRDSHEPGKDEFGRDIRPESPKSPNQPSQPPPVPSPKPPSQTELPKDPRIPHTKSPDLDSNPGSSSNLLTNNISSNNPNVSTTTNSNSQGPMGMETFDLAKFDYTSPASWEALGELWQVTNGYLPSTEQLMQFVMTSASMLSEMTPALEFKKNASSSIPNAVTTGGKAWGGAFLGGAGYSNRSMHIEGGMGHDNGHDNGQGTDAVVLGERSDGGQAADPNSTSMFGVQNESASVSSSGRMQKVGDKWVFVRGTPVGFS